MMQLKSFIPYIILLLGTNFVLTGCSEGHKHRGADPVAPVMSEPVILNTGSDSGRTLIGAWSAFIDPHAGSFTIEPAERIISFHYPLSNRYPDVLTVQYYNFGPPFIADLKLKHPLPGSGIDVFDPRVIAVLPANAGVSMDYPVMDIQANNSVVRQPDGYTKLWDRLSVPGNANPFKAYFKHTPYRMWPSVVVPEDTIRWVLDLDGFGGPIQFVLVVDISTKYPTPPQGIIDNAPEPIELRADIISSLEPNGSGEALINVVATDWQGAQTIGEVAIESPLVFNGKKTLDYSGAEAEPYKFNYSGSFTNELNAETGKYMILVSASDLSTGIALYQEFEFQIHGDISFNFQDLTPPDISLNPMYIETDGGFAYVISYYYPSYNTKRLHIFDLADPCEPEHAGYIELPLADYKARDGYIFCTSGSQGLTILKANPPSSPQIEKIVAPTGSEIFRFIQVDDNYAYISTNLPSAVIVDISIPEDACIHTQIPLSGTPDSFCFDNGYLYMMIDDQLEIYDVDSPQDYNLVYTAEMLYSECILVNDDYAYFTKSVDGDLEIYDVTPPQNFHHVAQISCSHVQDIETQGNIIYFSTSSNNILVYQMNNPQDITLLKNISIHAYSISVEGSVLYNIGNGRLTMFDIDPPSETHFVCEKLFTTRVDKIALYNGYACMTSQYGSLKIVDVDPISNAKIVRKIETSDELYYMCVHDGFAYVGCVDSTKIFIVDVRLPENAYIVKSIELPDGEFGSELHIFNDRLYAVSNQFENDIYTSWLYTYNISRPQSPLLIRKNEFDGNIEDFHIKGNKLFIISNDMKSADYLLRIYSLANPAFPTLISDISYEHPIYKMIIKDPYAYVIWFSNFYGGGLLIFDIDPPEDPVFIKNVYCSGILLDIYVDGDYVFGTTSNYSIIVFDIYPPEQASIVEDHKIYPSGITRSIVLDDNIAYIGNNGPGLRIFSLW